MTEQAVSTSAPEAAQVAAPVAEVQPQEVVQPVVANEAPVAPAASPMLQEAPIAASSAHDQVQHMIKAAGLNVQDVIAQVSAEGGEVSPSIMKALADKHGEGMAMLMAGTIKGIYESNVAATAAKDKAVFDQVQEAFKGITEQTGQETWKELAGWAKENIPTEERKEINKLLAAGGFSAKLAVDALVNRFKGSDGFTQQGQMVEADGVSNAGSMNPLSRDDYTRELRVLMDKGYSYESREVQDLQTRRMLGQKRGI